MGGTSVVRSDGRSDDRLAQSAAVQPQQEECCWLPQRPYQPGSPLITGHAAWKDLRSRAPLGAMLWNSTAAGAKQQNAHRVSSAHTQAATRLPIVGHRALLAAAVHCHCEVCQASAQRSTLQTVSQHSPSPFRGLTARCLRAHSLKPLFSPPGAGINGNVCGTSASKLREIGAHLSRCTTAHRTCRAPGLS